MLHYGKAEIRIIFVNCIACTKYWSSPFASLTCCSTVRIHWTVHYTWAVTSLSNADVLHHYLVKTLPVHFAVNKWFVHNIYYDMFLRLSSITSKICRLKAHIRVRVLVGVCLRTYLMNAIVRLCCELSRTFAPLSLDSFIPLGNCQCRTTELHEDVSLFPFEWINPYILILLFIVLCCIYTVR